MPKFYVSATLTVTDSGLTVEADTLEEAQQIADDKYGDPDAWNFHVGDGEVDVHVVEASR